MNKTASKHQLRRIEAAAARRRKVKYCSPLASKCSADFSWLSMEMFGVPLRKLSPKKLRLLSVALKTGAMPAKL